MERARLSRYGLLSVTGPDARDFLHAQLTNDVLNLAPDGARFAGWCSAKGRLLATVLVIPSPQGFLLQLARDLAPAVAKRLAMFVLRSKVKIEDASGAWIQDGVWDSDRSGPDVLWQGENASVRVGERRYLELLKEEKPATAEEAGWTLREIQAGRPFITAATQDLFVPQMVNLEKIGGVDFQKGCYPGQEIVARAQYRGEVKRRMVRLPAPAGAPLSPGAEFNGGVVVDSAGGEMLAVLPV
jgi:folate-binding protein YgfZ